MSEKSSKISEKPMGEAAPVYVADMQRIVRDAVEARAPSRGLAEAVWQAARDLNITTRRVRAILAGEVGRVWADEWDHARRWHAAFLAAQARRAAHEAVALEQRAAALRERLGC